MIYLVAILSVFFGGLVGHAPVHGRVYCRMIAFIIPVCLCIGLLNLPQLLDVVRTGFPPFDFQELSYWSTMESLFFLFASFLTGAGWLCSHCIRKVFED